MTISLFETSLLSKTPREDENYSKGTYYLDKEFPRPLVYLSMSSSEGLRAFFFFIQYNLKRYSMTSLCTRFVKKKNKV